MNVDIDPVDLLTDEQKRSLGNALFSKMLKGVEDVKFDSKPINLSVEIKEEIENILQNGDVWEYVNFDGIGKALSNKILKGIK